jgi:hypothetical protein
MEHKHAHLLRMAADNEDQLFECRDKNWKSLPINTVLQYPELNWRPVKQTKTIKRWLWAHENGIMSAFLLTEQEAFLRAYTTKLLWSETEFEVTE